MSDASNALVGFKDCALCSHDCDRHFCQTNSMGHHDENYRKGLQDTVYGQTPNVEATTMPFAKSVASDITKQRSISRKTDQTRIVCPYVRAMVHKEYLVPDENGLVEIQDVYTAMHNKTWADSGMSWVTALGIGNYPISSEPQERHRDRCLQDTFCFYKRFRGISLPVTPSTSIPESTKRYFNVYSMNGKEALNHGFSTGTMGGATNPPQWNNFMCNENGTKGSYPCRDRFDFFYADCMNKTVTPHRMYWKNLECTLCRAWIYGDKDGEFAMNPQSSFQKWQYGGALRGFLSMFGRIENISLLTNPRWSYDHYDDLFLTLSDMEDLFLKGTFPSDYGSADYPFRSWGNVSGFWNGATYPFPPHVPYPQKYIHSDSNPEKLRCMDEYNNLPVSPWEYPQTECRIVSDKTCNFFEGCSKYGNAFCGYNSKCWCNKNDDLISTCWDATKEMCVERTDECVYFDNECIRIPANNPHAPY